MNSKKIKRIAANLQINRSVIDHERILADSEAALEKSVKSNTKQPANNLPWPVWAAGLAAAFLIV